MPTTLGKMTCHPGLYSGGGWIIPMAFLLSNGWIRNYGCDSIQAASEYFSKSCVPGALSNRRRILLRIIVVGKLKLHRKI